MLTAVRRSSYTVLKGIEWEGLRVRASAHRCLVDGEDISLLSKTQPNFSVRCIGTIAWYSPGVDQHFIVFDDGDFISISLYLLHIS